MNDAYLGIKFHADQRNRPLIEALSKALAHAGWQTHCVVRDVERWGAVRFSAEILMQRTFAIIDNCAICVIDLSEKGVGLGIEAGYAYAKGIPVITIAHVSAEISETLRGISDRIIPYTVTADLTNPFRARLPHS